MRVGGSPPIELSETTPIRAGEVGRRSSRSAEQQAKAEGSVPAQPVEGAAAKAAGSPLGELEDATAGCTTRSSRLKRQRLRSLAFSIWAASLEPRSLLISALCFPPGLRNAFQRLKLNYPVAMGDERLGARYGGVLGLPLTFLIDRDGVVRARFQGEVDLNVIENRLKTLLAQRRGQE